MRKNEKRINKENDKQEDVDSILPNTRQTKCLYNLSKS